VNLGTEPQHVEVRKVERSARRCALSSAAGFAEGLNFSHQIDFKPAILEPEAAMNNSAPSLALVVEDDQFQREVLADLLKDENMDVIQCESAEAAELVIANCGADLKLLVTDVRLAGNATGIELAEFAHRRFPKLNIVMVSGYERLTLPPNVRFLKKPYRARDLLRIAIG
jgi:CheY-like chemotaxis protein